MTVRWVRLSLQSPDPYFSLTSRSCYTRISEIRKCFLLVFNEIRKCFCSFLTKSANVQYLIPLRHAKDKSEHNEIRDFYAHMALTDERRFARWFCRMLSEIFSSYFPYYPLHFLHVCFRIVLQNLYLSTCAADIYLKQKHAGWFCCDAEYRRFFCCRYSERIFYARKIW